MIKRIKREAFLDRSKDIIALIDLIKELLNEEDIKISLASYRIIDLNYYNIIRNANLSTT